MAFTIVPTVVFLLGLALTLFTEFFDWIVEAWERKHPCRE